MNNNIRIDNFNEEPSKNEVSFEPQVSRTPNANVLPPHPAFNQNHNLTNIHPAPTNLVNYKYLPNFQLITKCSLIRLQRPL